MGATVLGRHLFALGGNETAARLSGLPTRRLKAVAYGLSGMLAALGGVLFTGRSGQADPRLGVTYELYAITAAVVGGCSLSGGVGSIRGTVLGLFLIQIVIKGTGHHRPRESTAPRSRAWCSAPWSSWPSPSTSGSAAGPLHGRGSGPALAPDRIDGDGRRAPARDIRRASGSAARSGASCWGSRRS